MVLSECVASFISRDREVLYVNSVGAKTSEEGLRQLLITFDDANLQSYSTILLWIHVPANRIIDIAWWRISRVNAAVHAQWKS